MIQRIHCPSCGHAMDLCPHCNAPVDESWAFCPSCAGSLAPTQAKAPTPKAQAKAKPKKAKRRARKLKDRVNVYVSNDENTWIKDAAAEAGTSAISYLEELLQVAAINSMDTSGELPDRVGKKPFPLKLPKQRTREWFAAEATKSSNVHVTRYVVRQAMSNKP